jgi:hypothetical protein
MSSCGTRNCNVTWPFKDVRNLSKGDCDTLDYIGIRMDYESII